MRLNALDLFRRWFRIPPAKSRQALPSALRSRTYTDILFVDTNVFLQCRDLRELSWKDVARGGQVLLLVASPVLREIDRLKNDGNTRRNKRARKTTSLIREIINAADGVVSVCDRPPIVDIALAPPLCHTAVVDPSLDLRQADDAIIAEALAMASDVRMPAPALLTHDTNPIATAKRVGLPTEVVPDSWLLPPESDSRDKRIRELETRLRDLEENHPVLDIESLSSDGIAHRELAIEFLDYQPLEWSEIERLVELAQSLNPLAKSFNDTENNHPDGLDAVARAISRMAGIRRTYTPAADADIEMYRDQEYPNWIEKVSEFFGDAHSYLAAPTAVVSGKIRISNTGTVSATDLLISIGVSSGFVLEPEPDEPEDNSGADENLLPTPPTPPSGHWTQRSAFDVSRGMLAAYPGISGPLFDDRISALLPKKHDRFDFYWKDGQPDACSDKREYVCDEFRHKHNPEDFSFSIRVLDPQHTTDGVATIQAAATNLPNPAVFQVPIRVRVVTTQTAVAVEELLRKAARHIKD